MFDGVTRRELILGTGTALATGGIALHTIPQEGSASVAVKDLTVPDESYVLTDESISDVSVNVTAAWSWDGNADMTGYELRLKAGSTPDNAEEIAATKKSDLGKQALTGEAQLNGSLLNTSIYDAENFTPSNGEMQVSVVFVLEFVVKRHGEVVETATATDSATITIRKEELSVTVELSGTGEIAVSSSANA